MPNWKFWEKPPEPPPPPPIADPAAGRRFRAKPRTDIKTPTLDGAGNEQLARLQRQRDAVLFDVEQAEAALAEGNPWRERVALLDDAISAVRTDRDRLRAATNPPGRPLPSIPIEQIAFTGVPGPTVTFRIDGQQFRYEEAIDWAERGFQLARGELELMAGDPELLIPADVPEADRPDLYDHLTRSLFVFATAIRDRALEGSPFPESPTLADLARPDERDGGWFDWAGHSSAAARREHALRELEAEEQRLLTERDRELAELAKWQDRLPIAQRRLADVDAAIAALAGKS